MTRISAIIPAYNAERYIRRCIESIVSQSFSGLEIIIVNDGSSDNTGSISDSLAEEYPAVRVIHRENGGVCAARNTGIKAAQGEYLCFVDADDLLLPDALNKLWKKVEEHPGVDVVVGRIVLNGKQLKTSDALADFIDDRQIIRSVTLWELLQFSACAKLVSRNTVVSNNVMFVEGIIRGEDPLWNFMLHKHVKSVAQLREPVYMYDSSNTASAMHDADVCTPYLSTLKCAEYAACHYDKHSKKAEYPYLKDLLNVARFNKAYAGAEPQKILAALKRLRHIISKTDIPVALKFNLWSMTKGHAFANSLPCRLTYKILTRF